MTEDPQIIQDGEVTAVQLDIAVLHAVQRPRREIITATGSAKRHPKDRHDPETGLLLAQARMFAEIATTLYDQAWNRIDLADGRIIPWNNDVDIPNFLARMAKEF